MNTSHAITLTKLISTTSMLALSASCAAQPNQSSSTNGSPINAQPLRAPHILDGDHQEWSKPNEIYANDRAIHIHFTPPKADLQAIQAAPYTTRIRIDADHNHTTGRQMNALNLTGEIVPPQGVDLLIELSPMTESGKITSGSKITWYDKDGTPHQSNHAQIGMMFLPSYASPEYELRIDRQIEDLGFIDDLLSGTNSIQVVIDQVTPEGALRWSTTQSITLPALRENTTVTPHWPTKPKGATRIMSTNVLYSSPLKDPEPFQRIFKAMDPDIILYQEWFKASSKDVHKWAQRTLGKEWSFFYPDERAGVAIASKSPPIAQYERALPPSGEGRPARAIASLINTKAGELLVISVHLKCCGGANSPEDTKRIEQAQAINAFSKWVQSIHPNAQVLIGGDFNLVGSSIPRDTLAMGLARDDSDLTAAHTITLGDESTITWNDESSRFSPGRLDWILYDQSASHAINAFSLDTRNLSNELLEAHGLNRDDSKASDHLPMVIDLIARD